MTSEFLHVAVAAIVNDEQEVLISLRPDHVHQGGLWEFPGGKLEAGENVQTALQREIHEELGIDISRQRPLIRVRHCYPDRSVLLDVWKVQQFTGSPHGREGQVIDWVPVDSLGSRDFPVANQPIIRALQLPDCYLITPEPFGGAPVFLDRLQSCLENGIRLVQLRARTLGENSFVELARQVVGLCHEYRAELLLNADPALVPKLGADGVHLAGQRLQQLSTRPLPPELKVAASCHSLAELQRAQAIGADFTVLSPVLATASHPEAEPLGWQIFNEWTDTTAIPVYALGGLNRSDCERAFRHGAQGIAAIRGLWEEA
jgi:8-oxo-dGTP diphosphatase